MSNDKYPISNGQFDIGTYLKFDIGHSRLVRAAHPLFTKHTLQIDLTKSEEDLLKAMHPKARYNIKIAQKHDVRVQEESTEKAFKKFWELTQETTSRQHFFAHTKSYHLKQWGTLPHTIKQNSLSSHLLTATYQGKILTAWILFIFKNALYYPYGASSHEHRETMHSTLMMWEAMRFGKNHKLQTFDLWGAAAPNTPESDPWFGFTQFKERFGPEKVEFVGSYDLVINPFLYQGYKIADKLRWLLLRLRK
jgi:lipid II:glycine glycyltransferase (peptidoglycan interpeptide bridge formation enzyme)